MSRDYLVGLFVTWRDHEFWFTLQTHVSRSGPDPLLLWEYFCIPPVLKCYLKASGSCANPFLRIIKGILQLHLIPRARVSLTYVGVGRWRYVALGGGRV